MDSIYLSSENSILFCDIDDTILEFPDINKKWWYDKFEFYWNQTHSVVEAEERSLKDWIQHIEKNNPIPMIDMNNFKLHVGNNELVFITARNDYLHDLTMQHFMYCDFGTDHEIIYTNGNEKCNYIRERIKHKKYDHMAFVDDLENNLQQIDIPNMKLYHCRGKNNVVEVIK